MKPKKTPKAKNLCAFCGELCIFFPSYPNQQRKGPMVHDSCKLFYLLFKKLSKP